MLPARLALARNRRHTTPTSHSTQDLVMPSTRNDPMESTPAAVVSPRRGTAMQDSSIPPGAPRNDDNREVMQIFGRSSEDHLASLFDADAVDNSSNKEEDKKMTMLTLTWV